MQSLHAQRLNPKFAQTILYKIVQIQGFCLLYVHMQDLVMRQGCVSGVHVHKTTSRYYDILVEYKVEGKVNREM